MNNQAAQTMPELPEPWMRELNPYHGSGIDPYAGATHLQWYTADQMHQYARDYAAALAQTAGVAVSDEMVERACKDYALRVDGALWPDAYDEHEVLALRAQMREFLLNAIGTAPAASGGEDVGRGHGNPPEEYTDWEKRVWQRGYRAGMDGQHPSLTASNPPSAASVSERARASMKLLRFGRGNGLTPWILEPRIDGYWTPWDTAQSELDMAVESSNQLECALEQALTQQRVAEDGRSTSYSREALEIQGARWRALCRTIDHLSPGWDSGIVGAVDAASAAVRVLTAQATAPQPSADAVREYDRELIARMLETPAVFEDASRREQARLLREAENLEADARTVVRATDDHQQNAAQGGGEK